MRVAGLIIGRFARNCQIVTPNGWKLVSQTAECGMSHYDSRIFLDEQTLFDKNNSYLILSDGRYQSDLEYRWLRKLIDSFDSDVVLVNLEPALSIGREKLQLTEHGQLAGIRRIYNKSAQRALVPDDWPFCIFVRKSTAQNIFRDGISANFTDFKTLISDTNYTSIKIGGTFLDLETPGEFLNFITNTLESPHLPAWAANSRYVSGICRGEVHIGKNVQLGKNIKLIGPAFICSNAQVSDEVILSRSVICSGVKINERSFVHDSLILKSKYNNESIVFKLQNRVNIDSNINFRIWPGLSYAGFFKRLADIIVAAAVLILFAPVIAIIATLLKLTSKGPVFFGHGRQSLHGKNFNCLKFRSMITGADELQQKLRIKNEVDGPQFKMEDDPRVTPMGKFLRDTYLDEIPQFFNVLMGKMSLIGPRPSPEAENSLCAYWRDARLSVRPGMTGLWQVCRTRKAGNDFQEWVNYDSEYVRRLSLKLDVWIFWKTLKYLASTFVKQF